MIEGFGDDVEALIAWLGEMGMGESPQESLDGILAGWQPLLKRGTGALDAELSGAEFLRMFEVTVGDSDSADPLSQLVTDAASTGAPEALARPGCCSCWDRCRCAAPPRRRRPDWPPPA